jgi:hypothetical protein
LYTQLPSHFFINISLHSQIHHRFYSRAQ